MNSSILYVIFLHIFFFVKKVSYFFIVFNSLNKILFHRLIPVSNRIVFRVPFTVYKTDHSTSSSPILYSVNKLSENFFFFVDFEFFLKTMFKKKFAKIKLSWSRGSYYHNIEIVDFYLTKLSLIKSIINSIHIPEKILNHWLLYLTFIIRSVLYFLVVFSASLFGEHWLFLLYMINAIMILFEIFLNWRLRKIVRMIIALMSRVLFHDISSWVILAFSK